MREHGIDTVDFESNTFRVFMWNYFSKEKIEAGIPYEQVIDQQYIGDMETVFTMANGERIIFGELGCYFRYLPSSDSVPNRLTTEQWLKEFSRKVKMKMKRLKITQIELADQIGISRVTISRYVNGTREPNYLLIKDLADVFNCPISELTDFWYLE